MSENLEYNENFQAFEDFIENINEDEKKLLLKLLIHKEGQNYTCNLENCVEIKITGIPYNILRHLHRKHYKMIIEILMNSSVVYRKRN